MMKRNLFGALAIVAALALLGPGAALAQNVTVLDYASAQKIMCTKLVGGVNVACFVPQDSGGGDMTDATGHNLYVLFRSAPTVNLGTLNGAATAALQSSMITALGSPLQAGGAITTTFAATASVPINVSTAVTTQLVALSAGKAIYVGSLDFLAAGATNVTFEYGTGTNCATGTTALSGPYSLTASAGISKGNGAAAVLFVPASNALCMVNSAAIQVSGSVAYAQQ